MYFLLELGLTGKSVNPLTLVILSCKKITLVFAAVHKGFFVDYLDVTPYNYTVVVKPLQPMVRCLRRYQKPALKLVMSCRACLRDIMTSERS